MDQSTQYRMAIGALSNAGVRFVLIGVAGANYYAVPRVDLFATQDRDLFLPLDAANLLGAWQALSASGWSLWAGDEPLGEPLDLELAEQVVRRRAAVQATSGDGLTIDLTLVMAGFEFEEVWAERRVFTIEGHEVPVARLTHIVESKRQAGRKKDLLFLATHDEELRALLDREDD